MVLKFDNEQTGAAYYIPTNKQSKSFYIGKLFLIFTAELIGLQQAIKQILTDKISNQNLLNCMDSKSVIKSLQNHNNKYRTPLIYQNTIRLP